MPKKDAKKKKAEKSKKLPKPTKTGGMSSALKRAAKIVGKGLGLPAKKIVAPQPELKAKAKDAKDTKKAVAAPAPKGAPPPKAGKKAAAPAAPVLSAKDLKKTGKTPPALKMVPPAKGAKGKKEVVVELPAPKGVALLGRGKKAKSAEASASSKKRCREPGCEHDFGVQGYCRLHYIKNWRKIKRKEAILASGQLNNYVEELVSKYPDKYLDVIRQDLATEKDWSKVVTDMELDSSVDEAGDEEVEAAAESVRPTPARGGEFDDENESF